MSEQPWSDFIYGLLLIGFITVILLIGGGVSLVVATIINAIQNARHEYKIKHWFERKPIANCYCKYCKWYDPDKIFCIWTNDPVQEDGFCYRASPITEKMIKAREKEKATND